MAMENVNAIHSINFAASPHAAAQQSDDQYDVNANVNSSMILIVVVFICACLFIGMFSIFLRNCMASQASTAGAAGRGEGRSRRVTACGLSPAVIEMFPIFMYSAVKDLKIGKGALECAVCLNEFQDDESLRLIPKCDHVFHPDCVDPWLASHTTCPVCRADLVPDFNELVAQDSNESRSEENPSSELVEARDQVSISVNEDQSGDSLALEILNINHDPKLNGKFPRSHTTGHSLVQLGERFDSHRLRLPEEMRKEIGIRMKMKLTGSSDAVLPREGSSRRGFRSGEGSSGRWNWKGYLDRHFGRSVRVSRSDRWVFAMGSQPSSKVTPI